MNRKTRIALISSAVAGGVAVAVIAPIVRKRALRATAILKKDHRAVSALFFALQKTPNAAMRKSIFDQIRHELDVHAQVEEEIFYPAVRNLYTSAGQQQVDDANHEHAQIKEVLQEISKIEPDSYRFMSRCNGLKELVEHHVGEEEEAMFPLAHANMSAGELEHLGRRIHDRKLQLKERIAA